MTAEQISLAQARRIALAAQGFSGPQPARAPSLRTATAMVQRLGVIQIDAVNVLARAHLMPLFSRFGAYDVGLLDRITAQPPRRLVEAWAHEASFIPVETWPLLAWARQARRENPWHLTAAAMQEYPSIVEHLLELLDEHGPLTAKQAHEALVAAERSADTATATGWGSWSAAKAVLHYLFVSGVVTPAGRTPQFERRLDRTERVLPPEIIAAPTPAKADAIRGFVEISARALGVATPRELGDYFRLRNKAQVAAAIAELVDAGLLLPVSVRDGRQEIPGPWYRHTNAAIPRSIRRRALLNPFDPLVFERDRLKTLFDIDYRIGIYTPQHKRTHGYYVLMFLDGDRITARIDLKADRRAAALVVREAHLEPFVGPKAAPGVATRLAGELHRIADWLDLETIEAEPVGDLSGALAQVL